MFRRRLVRHPRLLEEFLLGMSGSIVAELLVDTDVCIDHLAGVRRLPRPSGRLAYSVVTRAELLAGANGDEPTVRRLLAGMDEIPVDRRVADRAGLLRRQLASLRLPDGLIAASALVYGVPLATRNQRDFRRVPGLRLRRS
jgi:predicted nucleic acid-binding protein